MEYKCDPMQSKSIAEVQMGSHACPFTFAHSRVVSLFIDYTHAFFIMWHSLLLTYDCLSIYWHLLHFTCKDPTPVTCALSHIKEPQ